jgi:hypothetical protein
MSFQIRFSIPDDSAFKLASRMNISAEELREILAEEAKKHIIKAYLEEQRKKGLGAKKNEAKTNT